MSELVFTGDAVAFGAPLLRVADVDRSLEFYCQTLGFGRDWRHDAGEGTPRVAAISRGGATLYLTEQGDPPFGSHAYFGTTEIDTLLHEWGARGVTIELAPTDMPWGLCEMHLRDPDGNTIRVAQPVACRH